MSNKEIPYWRDESFKLLEKFSQELRTDPGLILLAEYAELKGKGFRKQALKKLNEFIVSASSFKEAKRRELVQRICRIKFQLASSIGLLDSYNLTNQVIVPTLEQWILDETNNPEPLKWLGLFYYLNAINYNSPKFDILERSLKLNPKDDEVRKELIRRYLDCLDYSTHHIISDSRYIGDPSEDIEFCSIIENHLKDLQDDETRLLLSEKLKKYRHMIQNWQEYVTANTKISFIDWCSSKPSDD